MSNDNSPVFEKGYPSHNAVNRESYYDYMGRRMREDKENQVVSPYGGLGAQSKTITAFTLLELEIKNLNASYYSSLNRIKELVEENQELKLQIEELKNNANI